MNASEARRLLKEAGFYVERIMPGNQVEVWTNGKDEFRLGRQRTMPSFQGDRVRSLTRRATAASSAPRHLRLKDAVVGKRVRSLRDFLLIRKGCEGQIEYDYGTGFTVAFSPLNGGVGVRASFDKKTELEFLESI